MKAISIFIFALAVVSVKSIGQELQWVKQFRSLSDFSTVIYERGLLIDANGSVYSSGNFKGDIDFDPGPGAFELYGAPFQAFFTKMNPDGEFLSATVFGGFSINDPCTSSASIILSDYDNNVFLIGTFCGTVDFDFGPDTNTMRALHEEGDIFILKMNKDGEFIWARQLGPQYAQSGVTDHEGNLILSGNFYGDRDFDPGPGQFYMHSGHLEYTAYMVKLAADGNFVWAKELGGEVGQSYSGTTKIILDENDDLYLGGYFSGSVDFDPGPGFLKLTSVDSFGQTFISKFDTDGDLIWVKPFGQHRTYIHDMVLNAGSDQLFLTGNFLDPSDFDPGSGQFIMTTPLNIENGYVLKLDDSGNFISAGQLVCQNGHSESNSIRIDQQGNIITSGIISGYTDFDMGADDHFLGLQQGALYILKMSSTLEFIDVGLIGGQGRVCDWLMTTDAEDNIYILGDIQDTIDFDPGPAEHLVHSNLVNSYPDVFIAKYRFTTTETNEVEMEGDQVIQIYPNPADDYLAIESDLKLDQVTIADVSGKVIFKGEDSYYISTDGLENGMYFLKWKTEKGIIVKAFVVVH